MQPRGACSSSLSQLTRNCTSLPVWAVIRVLPFTISTRNTHGQVVSSVTGGSVAGGVAAAGGVAGVLGSRPGLAGGLSPLLIGEMIGGCGAGLTGGCGAD